MHGEGTMNICVPSVYIPPSPSKKCYNLYRVVNYFEISVSNKIKVTNVLYSQSLDKDKHHLRLVSSF